MQAKPDTAALIDEIYRAIETSTKVQLTDLLPFQDERQLRETLNNLILPIMEDLELTTDRYDDLQVDYDELREDYYELDSKVQATKDVVIFFQPNIDVTPLSWEFSFIQKHFRNDVEDFLPGLTKDGKAKTSDYQAIYVCTNQEILELITDWSNEERYVKVTQEDDELSLQFIINE